MILKLILIGAILIAIYKFAGGSLGLENKNRTIDKDNDSDSLDECVTCGTYVTTKESIQIKGKIYCSKECIPN